MKRILDLRDLPGEKWKDMIGFEGTYQISNKGRIKSLDRVITRIVKGSPRLTHIPEKILRTADTGSVRISMGKKNAGKSLNLSVLVAKAFMKDYIKGKTLLIHINGDPSDNRVENLLCGTHTSRFYNCLRLGKTMGNPLKKVKCIETGKIFDSIGEASRWLGYKTNIILSNYLKSGNKVITKYKYECKRKKVSTAKEYYSRDNIKGYHFELVD